MARPSSSILSTLDHLPWYLVDGLRVAWKGLDYGAAPFTGDNHHRLLDQVISKVKGRSVFQPSFYSQGFGPASIYPNVAKNLRLHSTQGVHVSPHSNAKPSDIDIPVPNVSLTHSIHGRDFARVFEGRFTSNAVNIPGVGSFLPEESHQVSFQMVIPTSWEDKHAKDEFNMTKPFVIYLPGTGEHGFRRRRHCNSYPLAKAGVASIILEGPYYGNRRPRYQSASKLHHFSDLIVLGRSTIEDTISLVKWLQHNCPINNSIIGDVIGVPNSSQLDPIHTSSGNLSSIFNMDIQKSPIVLAGVSKAGLHAAMTASLIRDIPVGVCSWLGPPSASQVFICGALSGGVDWVALSKDSSNAPLLRAIDELEEILGPVCDDFDPIRDINYFLGTPIGKSNFQAHLSLFPNTGVDQSFNEKKLLQTYHLLARASRLTDICNYNPPTLRSDAAIFTTASVDAYVPATPAVTAFWRHIKDSWKGAEIQTIRGGHVSGAIFSLNEYFNTVLRVIKILNKSTT
jgi:Alpha/beta hydrolase domain containing 18